MAFRTKLTARARPAHKGDKPVSKKQKMEKPKIKKVKSNRMTELATAHREAQTELAEKHAAAIKALTKIHAQELEALKQAQAKQQTESFPRDKCAYCNVEIDFEVDEYEACIFCESIVKCNSCKWSWECPHCTGFCEFCKHKADPCENCGGCSQCDEDDGCCKYPYRKSDL